MSTDATLHAPPPGILARAVQVWHRSGVTGVWFRVLHDLGLYRCYVISSNPLDLTRVNVSRVPCECALLLPDQLDEYMTFRPEQSRDAIRARLDDEHMCFVARLDGRIIGASWVCGARAYMEALDCYLTFADGIFYVYDDFVSPEYRGQEVMSAVAYLRRPTVAKAGFARSVGVTWAQNVGATRRSAKRKSRRIGVVGFVGLGRWRRHFLRLNPSILEEGPPPVRLEATNNTAGR